MHSTPVFLANGAARAGTAGLSGRGEALAQLTRLSAAASQQSDAIFRSMQIGNAAGAHSAPPFLATEAGNAALTELLGAGLGWLQRFFGNVGGAALGAASTEATQLALPLGR
jgi:hypothetical protein